MTENISLTEIKSLLLHILGTLNVTPTITDTTTIPYPVAKLSDDSEGVNITELLLGTFVTVPTDTLVLSTPAPAENPRMPMYLCCACGILNNPPPHELNLYYAVTKGLAVGVIWGITNVLPLTWKIPGSLFTCGPREHAAIAQFNEALAKRNVKILPA